MSDERDYSNASLLDLFRMELDAHSAVLVEGLVNLAGGAASPETLEALMRAAHSLKGAARTIGLQHAVDVAHAMEDCFVRAQEGSRKLGPEQVELLLNATDFLTHSALADAGDPEIRNKAAGIVAAFRDGAPASQPPAPAAKPARKPKAGKPAPEPEAPAVSAPPAEHASGNRAREAQPRSEPHGSTAPEYGRAVRVDAGSLSRLMGLAGETLVEAGWMERFEKSLRVLQERQNRLTSAIGRLREQMSQQAERLPAASALVHEVQREHEEFQALLSERTQAFEAYALRTDQLSHRLYREVVASRMRPFADGIRSFPRLAHDVARTLGKRVRFEVLGRNTEIDRDILDRLEAPIGHLLRNAIDHGIEPPQERLAAGKPEQGHVVLEAMHKGGMLHIAIVDDGRGVDLEQVRRKVVERGLATAEMAARMAESEVLEFLFLPGFSTSRQVTEISGRGVGLDVVKTMVQGVSGQVRVTSRPGQGCTFHVQLPVTLSVLRALLADIGGEPYAFPLARIARILKASRQEIQTLENYQYLKYDGQNIGLAPAAQVLELEQAAAAGDEVTVVVVGAKGEQYGLSVDRVLGEREIVVRPLDPRLGKTPNISGASLMEDGSPLLIVNVEDLVSSIRSLLSGGGLRKVASGGEAREKARKRVLVVDDSLTVREVERKLLENRGYHVESAADGAEGWMALRSGRFDLVITDVDMPRMNGLELVAAIRADTRFKDLPVMIVSYKDREEDRLRGMEAGANYYLVKSSFHDESLLGAVIDLIGEAR